MIKSDTNFSVLSSLPDELWEMIFRQASHVDSENINFTADAINQYPDGVMNWCHRVSDPQSYAEWSSAVRVKASIVLVCRRWNHIATSLLYSSLLCDGYGNDFLSAWLNDPLYPASYVKVLDISDIYDGIYGNIQALIPLCTTLRKFRSFAFFEPVSISSLFHREIQDLSLCLTLEQIRSFATISTEFKCLEFLTLTLIPWEEPIEEDQPQQITRVNLPNTLTFTFICQIWQDVEFHIPLSFNCPRVKNLVTRSLCDCVLPPEGLISGSSQLDYISMDYHTLAAIENTSPSTLMHSQLERACIWLSDSDPLEKVCKILATATNLHTVAFDFDRSLDVMQGVDSLLDFLEDRALLPKLTSIYLHQHNCWEDSCYPFLERLQDLSQTLEAAGVALHLDSVELYDYYVVSDL